MVKIPPDSAITLKSICYKIEDDPFIEPDYLGKFSDKWEKNAIRTKDNRWFISENHKWSNWQTIWQDVDEATKTDVVAKYGSLKAATYHYALEDLKRILDFENGKWHYVFIEMVATMEISINHLQFTSKLSDNLGGIESDSYVDGYILDMYSGLAAQLKTIFPMSQIKEALGVDNVLKATEAGR